MWDLHAVKRASTIPPNCVSIASASSHVPLPHEGERLGEGREGRALPPHPTSPPSGGEEDDGRASKDQLSRVPTASFEALANSPAPPLGPSAGFTRSTFMRPSAQTTVKPPAATSTISPSLPPTPLQSTTGSGCI